MTHGVLHGVPVLLTASALHCPHSRLPLATRRLLATGGADTLICIWDLHQAVPHTIIYRPDEAVRALSFSADHALLAYCQDHVPGQPSTVEVMDTKTGAHGACVCGHARNSFVCECWQTRVVYPRMVLCMLLCASSATLFDDRCIRSAMPRRPQAYIQIASLSSVQVYRLHSL